jgi:hypothetical protein
MSIQRVVSHEPLTDAECRSLAPARAKRLAYSLSGRARYLYEMLTGEPAVDDGGATPLNPQGRMGVDRSGPPWGDAHMHPMWVFGMCFNEVAPIYPSLSGANRQGLYLNGGVGTIVRIVARFYVRPHYAAPDMPYTRAYLRGVGISDDLVTLSSASIRVYGPDGDSGPASQMATVSTTTAATFSTGAWCPVSPGYNERIIEIEQTSANGIYIGPLSLNQVVRRSH